jgi:hypothetical protein
MLLSQRLEEHAMKGKNPRGRACGFFDVKRILLEKQDILRNEIKAKPRTHLGLASLVWMRKASGLMVSITRGQHVLYHSKRCNRRGDHSWARMEPASLYRTQHKPLYTFVAGRAHDRSNYHHHLYCDELHDNWDSDWADSSDPFADRTLVLQQ